MTITTTFNIGGTVWFVDENTLLPVQSTVSNIQALVTNAGTTIKYLLNTNPVKTRLSTQVFATQQALSDFYQPI